MFSNICTVALLFLRIVVIVYLRANGFTLSPPVDLRAFFFKVDGVDFESLFPDATAMFSFCTFVA